MRYLNLITESPNYDIDLVIEERNPDAPRNMYAIADMFMLNEANKNGRRYLEEDMVPAIKTYVEDLDSGGCVGELNHCVPDSYKILTTNGWKQLKDVDENEVVATLNINDQTIHHLPISEKIHNHYTGKMIRFKGLDIDFLATPNHRILLIDDDGKYFYTTSQEILDNQEKFNKCVIPNTNESQTDFFEIYLTSEFLSITEEDYDGYISCVTNENHNFYCMDDSGNTCWTGNSAKPDVDLDRICHRIVSLEREKDRPNFYKGKNLILDTVQGRTLKTLSESKVRWGFSSKALGAIEESSKGAIVRSPIVVSCDAVFQPSIGKFSQGILENMQFIIGADGKAIDAYDKLQKKLAKYPSKHSDAIKAHILESLETFLKSI